MHELPVAPCEVIQVVLVGVEEQGSQACRQTEGHEGLQNHLPGPAPKHFLQCLAPGL